MVYFEKFVASLKVNGKFLRNNENVIELPFGSEYILFLKNMESRDAVVKVSIDGKDVLSGHQLILRGNTSLELEGFLEGNEVKNKFKFIELTKEIEEFRGIRAEDSLVRIEFRFEKRKEVVPAYMLQWKPVYYYLDHPNEPNPYVTWTATNTSGDNWSGTTNVSARGSSAVSCFASAGAPASANNTESFTSDLGITVKGNQTYQGFNYGSIGDLEEESHVMILKLNGYKDNKLADKVVTTQDKKQCPTCGLINSGDSKFCKKCGTFLS